MKYYLAYGSNLNINQMKYRCPEAIVIGSGILKDYKLVFKSFLTIEKSKESIVPVGIWCITDKCEKILDRFEGYPGFYRKEEMNVEVDDKQITAMIYIMNDVRKISPPSAEYMNAVKEGYQSFNFDSRLLDAALANSFKK